MELKMKLELVKVTRLPIRGIETGQFKKEYQNN